MQKIVSLPALKSWLDLLFPCSFFNTLTKLREKKIRFVKHGKHRLLGNVAYPSLTYFPQSLLRKENGDWCVFRKQQVAARGTQAVSLVSSCFYRPLSSSWNKGLRHTQMQPEERSRHHAVCQLFTDHSLQFSNQLEAFIYSLGFYCFRSARLKQQLVCPRFLSHQ